MCQQGTPLPDPHTRLRNGLRSDLLGDRWLAIQSLEDLLREFPDFHEARGHLAWIYSLQGNNPAAIEHLKYLVREADNPIAQVIESSTRGRNGRVAESRFRFSDLP